MLFGTACKVICTSTAAAKPERCARMARPFVFNCSRAVVGTAFAFTFKCFSMTTFVSERGLCCAPPCRLGGEQGGQLLTNGRWRTGRIVPVSAKWNTNVNHIFQTAKATTKAVASSLAKGTSRVATALKPWQKGLSVSSQPQNTAQVCSVQNLRLHVYQGLCHIDPWRKQNLHGRKAA